MRSRAVAMVMPMVLAATCACAALGLTENSGLSERELTSLRTQFLWADPARKVPAFIPQEVLETTPIDKLPLNIDNKEFLEAQVKSFATRNYACNPPGGLAMPQGSAKRTYSLDELVSLGYSAFVGQIVHLAARGVTGFAEA